MLYVTVLYFRLEREQRWGEAQNSAVYGGIKCSFQISVSLASSLLRAANRLILQLAQNDYGVEMRSLNVTRI